jgi:hypothetical protein
LAQTPDPASLARHGVASGCPAILVSRVAPLLQPYNLYNYPHMFKNMAGRAPLVVPALKKHTATVIVAHGLGDSGAGW